MTIFTISFVKNVIFRNISHFSMMKLTKNWNIKIGQSKD